MTTLDSTGNAGRDDPAEKALAVGLAAGSRTAVAEFLERTHRPVYAMTARLTLDPDLRHDWTQEILLKIVDEMGRGRFVYRWPGCFWSWFGKRSHFLLINLYRRHRTLAGRLAPQGIGEEIVDRLALPDRTDPARLMESVEARAIIEDCLAALDNSDHRQALRGVLLAEESYQEVAERLGATLNTVRSWIRRARGAVRRCVEDRYSLLRRNSP